MSYEKVRTRLSNAVLSSGLSLLLTGGLASAAEPPRPSPDGGVICFAPFSLDPAAVGEPAMSTTPKPSAQSVFKFVVDERLEATVKGREGAMLSGVPTDRKVKVEVRLDGKSFETFWLNLGKEPDRRACLWLYQGYWHWVNTGWDPKKGCDCKPAA